MRDIPIFTSEYGVASLVLKEIPYKQTAYIRIRTVQPGFLKELVDECAAFCRMAGAEHMFAAADEALEGYPLACSVWQMRGSFAPDPDQVACLFPVTEETVDRWRRLCNQAMASVDNSATLESRDEKQILESGGAYFVHDGGRPLGLGWVEEGKLLTMAALERGAGTRVLHTLMTLVPEETLELEVASTNERALHLYKKMGFVPTAELSRWYRVK